MCIRDSRDPEHVLGPTLKRRPGARVLAYPVAPAQPSTRSWRRGMAEVAVNPNQALWEKGDFTRIAATMRESGEALVQRIDPVSYTHLRAHETPEHLVCRLLLEK